MARKLKVTLDVDSKTGVASVKKVTKSVEDMERKSVKASKNITSQFNKMKAGFLIISAVITAATIKMSKEILDYGDKLHKLNLKLGVTVSEMDKLRKVAELSGIKFSTLAMGMQRMVRRVNEAATGIGVAKDALGELGLKAKELSKLKPEEQFKIIAEKLSKLTDKSRQVTLAFKLFDSEGVSLIQMFKDLDKQLATTTTEMDQKTVESFATFNDNITKIYDNLKDFLIPKLEVLADTFNKVYDSAQGKQLGLKGKAIEAGYKEYPLLQNDDRTQAEKIQYNKMRESYIEMLYKQYQLQDEIGKSNEKIIESGNKPYEMDPVDPNNQMQAKQDEWFTFWSVEKAKQDMANEVQEAITDALRSEQLKRENLHKLSLQKYAENVRTFREADAKSMEEYNKYKIELDQQYAAERQIITDQINNMISSGMTDALSDWVDGTKSASDAFKDFASDFLKQIAKMIIQTTIFNALQNNSSGGTGVWGSIVGGLASMLGKAAGGGVNRNQSYIVGEKGPEVFTPGTGGAITPNNKLGGGEVTVVNNIQIEASGDPQQDEKLARQTAIAIETKIKEVIGQQKRYGGLLFQGA